MNTATITPETLSNSVIAVPPLARDADLNVCATENTKIMQHLEAGEHRTAVQGGEEKRRSYGGTAHAESSPGRLQPAAVRQRG